MRRHTRRFFLWKGSGEFFVVYLVMFPYNIVMKKLCNLKLSSYIAKRYVLSNPVPLFWILKSIVLKYDQELCLYSVKKIVIRTTEITLNILCVYIIEAHMSRLFPEWFESVDRFIGLKIQRTRMLQMYYLFVHVWGYSGSLLRFYLNWTCTNWRSRPCCCF